MSFSENPAIVYYSTFFFHSNYERVAQQKTKVVKVGELGLFQPCNHLLEIIVGKITGVLVVVLAEGV